MQKRRLYLFGGWLVLMLGLLLAVVAGTLVGAKWGIGGSAQRMTQAVVMSVVVIPPIAYLYRRMHFYIGRPDVPAYAFRHLPHVVTGFMFAFILGLISLFAMHVFQVITIETWYSPLLWIRAMLFNVLIALFYEALPEELAMRGLIYDILRLRLSLWRSVFIQAIIFTTFSASISLLLVLIGLSPSASLLALPSNLILHFLFAIALALIREWTDSLWAAVGFHLGYLEVVRFLLMPVEYGASPIVTIKDHIMDGAGASMSVMVMILSAIFIPYIILVMRKKWKKVVV